MNTGDLENKLARHWQTNTFSLVDIQKKEATIIGIFDTPIQCSYLLRFTHNKDKTEQ